jgi:hypothetical protein
MEINKVYHGDCMEIKTTEQIWNDFCKQLGLEVLEVGAKTNVNGWCRVYQEENKDKKWISVTDLINHIENSKSPDGDYPDVDCIIDDLRELTKT